VDVFAHGLWVFGICKGFKFCRNQNALLATFLSIFPDIASFTPVALYGAYLLLTFQFPFDNLYALSIARGDFSLLAVRLSYYTYLIMHSYVSVAIAFLLLRKKELWGWFAHITVDIFTHSVDFNPTRFLWPFSNYVFDGIRWNSPYFWIPNWFLLGSFYFYLWKSGKINSAKTYKYFKKQLYYNNPLRKRRS